MARFRGTGLLILICVWPLVGIRAGQEPAAQDSQATGEAWTAPDKTFTLVIPEGWDAVDPPPGPRLELRPSAPQAPKSPQKVWILATERIPSASMPRDAGEVDKQVKDALAAVPGLSVSECKVNSYPPAKRKEASRRNRTANRCAGSVRSPKEGFFSVFAFPEMRGMMNLRRSCRRSWADCDHNRW